ncbi:MAG: LysR family transcriptional regulator [Merdibacter sp.]
MEIRTLYSFLCAAREGNITKAAEKLHLASRR